MCVRQQLLGVKVTLSSGMMVAVPHGLDTLPVPDCLT